MQDLPKMNISQDNDNSYITIDCANGEDYCSHVNIVKLSSNLIK